MFWSYVPFFPIGTILLLLFPHIFKVMMVEKVRIYIINVIGLFMFFHLLQLHTKNTHICAFHCAKDMDGWNNSRWDLVVALLFTPLQKKNHTSCLLSFIEGDNTLCIWPLIDWQYNVDCLEFVKSVCKSIETRTCLVIYFYALGKFIKEGGHFKQCAKRFWQKLYKLHKFCQIRWGPSACAFWKCWRISFWL